LRELLSHYSSALVEGQQHAEAAEIAQLAADWQRSFVKVMPAAAKLTH
jgi:hypothetical protein